MKLTICMWAMSKNRQAKGGDRLKEKIVLVVDGYNLLNYFFVDCGNGQNFSLFELVDLGVITLQQAREALTQKLAQKFPSAEQVEIFLVFDSSHIKEDEERISQKKKIITGGRRFFLVFTQNADDAIFYLGFWVDILSDVCNLRHIFVFTSKDRELQNGLEKINGISLNIWQPEQIFRDREDKFIKFDFSHMP